MTEQHFLYLLDGFKQQKLSREELILFLDAAAQSRFESLVGDQLIKDIAGYRNSFSDDPAYQEMIWESLNNKRSLSPVRPVHRVHFLRKWSWAAASIILVLGIGAYLWMAGKKNTAPGAITEKTVDITPGKEGAILTLADGTQVVLDSLGNGVIALQNGSQAIIKNGTLTYDLTGKMAGEVVYNTMTTPKGRQFSLLLPDGTKVWLNAASSIRYPTVFTGKERSVAITGEAYFEVAKNEKIPFRASVNNIAEVEVLGTHFNVNAYENERSIHTTLLEGSIAVYMSSDRQQHFSSNRPVILKPGQQARVLVGQKTQPGRSGEIKVINNADIDKVMAWKHGLFNFEDATLEDVMHQLERWYDIEVVYANGIPDIEFGGKLTKDISLGDLLIALEKSKVHFRIEGRKLIVLP